MSRPILLIALALALPATGGAVAQDTAQAVAYDAQILTACRKDTAPGDARSCIGKASAQCMKTPDGSTTVGMVSCMGQELDQWDAMLNASYAALLETTARNDGELAKLGSAAKASEPILRDAQRKWVAWRDAECSFVASKWQGGSGAGPAATSCAMTLTAERALALDAMRGEER